MDGYGKRVLVVDDNESARALIGILLEDAGYNVVRVTNGLDALCEITKRHFDVIVTDWAMPLLNGQELIQRIQEMQLQVPVILVSGNPPEGTEAAEASQWFGCLRKPFDNSVLLHLVRSASQLPTLDGSSTVSSTSRMERVEHR